ncbi:hypothetical protein [Mammaliicoccus sciuri]|nr:hypothetical protein [Mammaliicoccus sciuri]
MPNIEVLIPKNDIAHYVNQIVESIPNEEFYEFKHSRGEFFVNLN